MSDSSSGGHSRRCPKCRRRMSKIALRCFHCNWEVPYRQVYLMIIALGIGLVGVVVVLSARRIMAGATPTSDDVIISKPRPGMRK